MTLEPHGMNRLDVRDLISDIYSPFSDCYVFKSRICNVYLLPVFIFPVTVSVEGLCCKPKYRANIIHHVIFVFFPYFFYHSSSLNLWFGTQDFADPGLLKIRPPSLVCSCGFAFTSVSNCLACSRRSYNCCLHRAATYDLWFSDPGLISTLRLSVQLFISSSQAPPRSTRWSEVKKCRPNFYNFVSTEKVFNSF